MVPCSHMGCLVFVRASLFIINFGYIFGPGHFKPVAPICTGLMPNKRAVIKKLKDRKKGEKGKVDSTLRNISL